MGELSATLSILVYISVLVGFTVRLTVCAYLCFRELMETGQSQRAQQASVEEQLVTVEQSLQEQNSAAHSLHSELLTQLEAVQKQVAQVTPTGSLTQGLEYQIGSGLGHPQI